MRSSLPRSTAALAAVLCLCGCPRSTPSQLEARAEETCERAEQARKPDPGVRAMLASQDPSVRRRAALAVGRIGDPAAAPDLAKLLDQDVESAELAAWALGRIESGDVVLASCLSRNCPAAAASARALSGPASVKTATQVPPLTAALSGPAPVAAEAGVSLGVLARSGQEAPASAAHDALLRGLGRPEPEVRAGAAYALGRIAPGSGGDVELSAALRDPDPWIRSLAARAWGKQGLHASGLFGALRDPDWRVRVEAARGLAFGGPDGRAAALNALPATLEVAARDARMTHAAIVLLETAGAAAPEPPQLSGATPAATVALRCAAALARDRARLQLTDTPSCGASLEPEWRSRMRAGALAAELSQKQPALVERARAALRDRDGRVRGATAGAAGAALADDLIALLADPDQFVVQEAAGALAKDAALATRARDAALRAIERFAPAKDRPAGDPAADALAAFAELVLATAPPAPPRQLLALQPVRSVALHRALKAPPPPPPPNIPAEAQKGPPARLLRLRTTAGELVVELRNADAPLTAQALANLTRGKFYDGLSFHRVVPDFVAQGGDPRGDGDGGPGWSLPDEHTPLRFSRGTLGIATSGPETGASQFFLCHSPQPHLDSRYTIAGELQSGGDVLDSLQPGDTIVSATVE